MLTRHSKKSFAIFGKCVIINTRWLSERDLILKNARTAKPLDTRCELDRSRDGLDDRLLDTLADRAITDDINECPSSCRQGHSLHLQLLPEREQG